jgi:hypothetical protein
MAGVADPKPRSFASLVEAMRVIAEHEAERRREGDSPTHIPHSSRKAVPPEIRKISGFPKFRATEKIPEFVAFPNHPLKKCASPDKTGATTKSWRECAPDRSGFGYGAPCCCRKTEST